MTEAKELKPGNYIKLNNEILKVVRKEVVAYGTHSHSKTKLFVQGLFSKGEKSFNLNHHDNVEMVDIIRKEGQVVSKLPDKVQVMDNVSYETVDADADSELLGELNEGDTVTFINFEGKARVLEKR
jgi:translation elongation factor P/translation initiation factor 5A